MLAGEVLHPPPIWLMRQAGRYLPEYREIRAKAKNFLNFCFRPELAIEATLQPIRRYGFDAAILFSDIMVVPHALGQKVWFEEGVGPRLEPVTAADQLDRLSFDGFERVLGPVYQTVAGIARELDETTALIGFAGAPWTVASYMVEGGGSRDFAKAKAWAYGDPEGFQRLIDLLVEATAGYLSAQVEAGAEALQLFDSWAGALPEQALRRWCLAPAAEIVRRVKQQHPGVPIILFPRGAGLLYRDFARESGADALSLDTTVPLAWARDEVQSKVAVQGNLDPILLVTGGEALRRGAGDILETLGRGRFVFNLGAGIIPEADPQHVADLVELVRAWRA
ncbi:MAG: uroporphyrinogen decarboxylase [Inquilinus sp.]|nr:uroporphyrinogen decarboxylase [Inquilinus sp.]